MKLLKQVTLDRALRKKDRSVSITFITELEQNSKEFMEIDEMISNSGVLYFKQGDITTQEIKALDDFKLEEKELKSPSQRLRNVLYLIWKREVDKNATQLDFPTFYSNRMEKVINHYKDMLD